MVRPTTRVEVSVNAAGEKVTTVWVLTDEEAVRQHMPRTTAFPDAPMSEGEFQALTLRNHPRQSHLREDDDGD